jgi:hypothetical protein
VEQVFRQRKSSNFTAISLAQGTQSGVTICAKKLSYLVQDQSETILWWRIRPVWNRKFVAKEAHQCWKMGQIPAIRHQSLPANAAITILYQTVGYFPGAESIPPASIVML